MKKRFMPTLVAFIVLVLLIIYANEYETEEILSPGEQKSVSILGYKDSELKSLSFGKGREYTLKVEFKGSESKIVSPASYKCDNAEAFGIARHFTELESEHSFTENATDTTVFGINADSPCVKIETASGVAELILGDKVAVGNSLYLKKMGDEAIYIVPAHIKGSFGKTLTDLRDRALYSEDFGNVNEISYTLASESLLLVQNAANGEWLISGTEYSADHVTVANLINNMRNLRISNFEDGKNINEPKYGLETPHIRIVMKNESGKSYQLKAGSLQGTDTYVSSDDSETPLVQTVNTMKVNELMLSLSNFREKSLSLYSISEITEIEVADATGSVKIVKSGSNWLNREAKVNESEVKSLINSFARSNVSDFLPKEDLAEYGLADKEKCSRLVLKSGDKTKTYWFGTNTGLAFFIMDEKEVIRLDSEPAANFNRFIHKLRSSDANLIK